MDYHAVPLFNVYPVTVGYFFSIPRTENASLFVPNKDCMRIVFLPGHAIAVHIHDLSVFKFIQLDGLVNLHR